MRYQFGSFEFDTDNLVLTNNNEAVDIRHNEAKVLALLLEQSDMVLSKDDILSHVWQNKIVSEQAVFQNISNLRNLFGPNSIKTFSKRGYQWRMEHKVVEQEAKHKSPNQDIPSTESQTQSRPNRLAVAAVSFTLAILVILGFSATFNDAPINQDTKISLAYIAIPLKDGQTELTFSDNDEFDFTALTHISKNQFQDSAELEYPRLARLHPFILSGELREFNDTLYLDFLLKGPYGDWSGQIDAPSISEMKTRLLSHLSQPFIYQLLGAPQAPELELANLSIAHQSFPNDAIVLGKLINAYIETEELEKAMAMAEKLANLAWQSKNQQQLGNALLYQSQILTTKELYELSIEKLSMAIEQFEDIGDLKRQADAWNAQSWLDHKIGEYEDVKTSLLTSARLALAASDKARELHALTYLSVMASKHSQHDDKYAYLRTAENKMKAYELPIYHFAKVPFHYAIFAGTPSAKEPHLKQVLVYTELTPDHWVAQSSRRQLVKHYLAQNRLEEAREIVSEASSDNAENSYLKTMLAQAEERTDDFIKHAQRTFEQAQLAGDKHLSLDVALMLITSPDTRVNFDFYSQYIDDNANKHWRRNNKERLLALKSKE